MSRKNYYRWSPREDLLVLHKYVRIDRLLSFIDSTLYSDFWNHDVRRRILLELPASKPFNKYERFPEDYYANISYGPIARAYTRLTIALHLPKLDLKDTLTYKFPFNRALEDLHNLTTCVDIEKMADNGIYNRESFEKRFNMKWIDENDDDTYDTHF